MGGDIDFLIVSLVYKYVKLYTSYSLLHVNSSIMLEVYFKK